MKRKLPVVFFRFFLLLLFVPVSIYSFARKAPSREFYQLTVYHFKTPAQEQVIDGYLQNALLPALHKLNFSNVGVFKAWANDTVADKMFYVFITIKSLDQLAKLPAKLNADAAYQTAGAAYINAVYKEPAYVRIENILLHAFPLAPKMQLPQLQAANKDRVYELRSYESASEKIFANKVQMFNQGGEIDFFKRLNFNAVFYSEVIAGSKMPNLMYMTTFNSMADRDAHWKLFVDDPFWKTLSAKPEYQNNVSRNDITFLQPTSYSDF